MTPPAPVVRIVEATPPADLLVCPAALKAASETEGGILPADKRAFLEVLALAYGDLRAQLVRLIEWHAPGACAPPPRPSPP